MIDYLEKEKEIKLAVVKILEEVINGTKDGKEYNFGHLFLLSSGALNNSGIETILNKAFLYDEMLEKQEKSENN